MYLNNFSYHHHPHHDHHPCRRQITIIATVFPECLGAGVGYMNALSQSVLRLTYLGKYYDPYFTQHETDSEGLSNLLQDHMTRE